MSSTSPHVHRATSLPAARRRDGIALAATGTIPHRVRRQILAEHHADLTARARARVVARIDAGLYPLPVPYGYRQIGPDPSDAGDTAPRHLRPDLTGLTQNSTINAGRAGRAPALRWCIDPDCAHIVEVMSRYVQYDVTPAKVARILNLDRDHPPRLTVSGHPQRWTGRAIRSLLTDPVLTGHSVWGRTHHGRPRPRHAWIISAGQTHPSILDAVTFTRMVEILLGTPNPTASSSVCSARSGWHR